ncbi:Asp23/Gls24 family envelope stress response protein [uncultured Faecalicoccus sp.]|uniref:Asp23/Gls24 family envelope stress response protein n=1 Tax=uncultured Faecalicoccus sp. TaxID=1971760 RepID=UPI0025FD5462|nr:Asp23/Gls24 family envelope stress response protein [uncultured Faecalicoccus sp.]
MAQEYITLENQSQLGTVKLNKSVFSSIALNVIEEDENVKLVENTRLRNSNTLSAQIQDNQLTMVVPVQVNYKANVSDVCANLQHKIFESISYMTGFKPESIEIQVVGFIF